MDMKAFSYEEAGQPGGRQVHARVDGEGAKDHRVLGSRDVSHSQEDDEWLKGCRESSKS